MAIPCGCSAAVVVQREGCRGLVGQSCSTMWYNEVLKYCEANLWVPVVGGVGLVLILLLILWLCKCCCFR